MSANLKQLIAAFAVLMAAGVGSFFLIAPPTGKEFVVFASGTAATISDDFDLWRVSLDGSGLRKLTTDYRGISMATVSKDGKTIVFCGRLETVAGLYAIDERGDITQLTSARMFAESVPTFHPDGNTLVFQEAVSDKVVNIMELDMLSGGKTPLIANGFINRDPCISPDGRKIVYVSNVSGTFRLYVADIDGKNARAIRRHDDLFLPAFGPGSDEIWVGSRSAGKVKLLCLDLHGTVLRSLPISVNFSRPAIRADGTMVCDLQIGGNVNLYLVSREGKVLRQLTNGPLDEMYPAIGPAEDID